MGKQIMRVESIHSMQAFAAKFKHNYRIGDVPNVDKTCSHMNEQIIRLPAGETYNTFFEKRILELPYYDTHKVRKNATLGMEFMLSYGLNDLPENFSVQEWAKQSKQFLIDQFGKENIASAVLHMDENTPHIHAIIIPIKDGKLSARAFVPDRQAMRNLHTKYHEYTKEVGLEPENQYMKISHKKTGMFYSNINMALEKTLPGPRDDESLYDYSQRANEFYQQQCLRMLGKDHKISQLSKEKKALEKANQALEKAIEKKYQDYIKGIMTEIGSVENAKHAIRYRDNLQKGIEWTAKKNPELAQNVEMIIDNIQRDYDREVLSRRMNKEESKEK